MHLLNLLQQFCCRSDFKSMLTKFQSQVIFFEEDENARRILQGKDVFLKFVPKIDFKSFRAFSFHLLHSLGVHTTVNTLYL